MKEVKFQYRKNRGSIGEDFFKLRHNELLANPIVLLKDMTDWDVEGSDYAGMRLIWTPSTLPDETGNEKPVLIPKVEYGGVEIKTLGPEQFLPRFGINDILCGTIGFPTWGKSKDLEKNDWTEYTRDDHGNLKRWMQPSVENRGSRPISIVHLLEIEDADNRTGQGLKRYFASIAFENVPALLSRLTKYLQRFGLDITDWSTVPIREEARNLQIEGLFLQGNMIHVPLSELEDLMTVTLIGEEPEIYDTGRCSAYVQKARFEYLKKIANGRWIPQIKPENGIQSDEELCELWQKMLLLTDVPKIHYMDRKGRQISP